MSIHVDRFSDDFEIEIFQPGSLTGSLKKNSDGKLGFNAVQTFCQRNKTIL